MQFIDLKAQQQRVRPEIERRIQTVLDHGQYIMGPEVRELEQGLAQYVETRYAVTCASGTDALLMALMAFDIGPGDAVFTTPFTFMATAEVIALLGATPVFVDIDPQTFNIDPDQLDLAIQAVLQGDPSLCPLPSVSSTLTTDHRPLTPKAVIPVDLFGLPCDYDRINSVVSSYNQARGTKHNEHIVVIEDAAQSLGARYKGRMAGGLGDVGCTSFFPAKPLGAYGDGGAVFTDDQHLAEQLQSIRVHGKGSHKYDNARIGLNGRLDTMQAAILLAKMEIFPEEVELRQQVAHRYNKLLSAHPSLQTPHVPAGHTSAWAQYSVLAKDSPHRERLQGELKEQGIPSVIYYPKPLHVQSAFHHLGYQPDDFPVSQDCASRIFSLPMHPYVTEEEQKQLCRVLEEG
ncbi:MAG: DegT/DnrJ/EryC1/StrS family aminotransferase [Desulfovermiculus sp.]